MCFPKFSSWNVGFAKLPATKFVILPLALSLCGCVSHKSQPAQITNTLSGSRRLPSREIKEFISPATWQEISNREFSRYVVIGAEIKPDGSVTVGRVLEAYPDTSYNEIARSFGKEVVLRAGANTGSMLLARGEIHVIFFKPESWGNLVLIYGQQVGQELPRGGGMVYRGQRLGMADAGLSQCPKYIRTLVYKGD